VFCPSGEQLEITCDDQRAIVAEVGAGLRSFTVAGRDVIDGYAAGEMCTSGRGQLLAPWPNRIEDGRYEYGGLTHQLALDEPETRCAIHGLTRWDPWIITDWQAGRVLLENVVHPQPGYPFLLGLQVEYALSQTGLTVTSTATNLGPRSCPYGVGAHPYLTLGTQVDELLLTAPAKNVLLSDGRGLPQSELDVRGSEYDFRSEKRIASIRLDHCFTNLERDANGLAWVALSDAAGGHSVRLWMDASFPYLMLFSGDSLPDVSRRSLAVEPMTCPPNAFRSGEGVIHLQSGQSVTSAWGICA